MIQADSLFPSDDLLDELNLLKVLVQNGEH